MPSRLASIAALALIAAPAAVLPGCRCRSTPSPGGAPPVASSGAPVVVHCYYGCRDLNKGKPGQDEIHVNCATKCSRICSKSCAADRPKEPRERVMAECRSQCERQLGSLMPADKGDGPEEDGD